MTLASGASGGAASMKDLQVLCAFLLKSMGGSVVITPEEAREMVANPDIQISWRMDDMNRILVKVKE